MIDGQVADPEDTYRSYALNAFAYAGLKSAAFLYSACGKNGGAIDARAEELKENIPQQIKVKKLRDGSQITIETDV